MNHADTNEFFTPTKYGYADAAALLGLPTPNWGGDPNSNQANMINYMQSASAPRRTVSRSPPSRRPPSPASCRRRWTPAAVISYNADGIYKNGVP